jgi:hypothetical protein
MRGEFASWFAAFASLAYGCSSAPPETKATNAELQPRVVQLDSAMIELSCAETAGDRCSDCRAEADARRSECFDIVTSLAISDGYAPVDSCARAGSTEHCSIYCTEPADECRSYEHAFVPTTSRDDRVFDACQRAQARDARCEEVSLGPACDVYAQVEVPSAAKAYDCVASTLCGEEVSHCFDVIERIALGDELAERCKEETLDEETIAKLNHQAGWNTEEFGEALLECSTMYCGTGELNECAKAWWAAMTGIAND